MSSPTDEEERIPSDFIHCVQKLLSSVSTLNKHLSLLTTQKDVSRQNEELTNKLQVRNQFSFFQGYNTYYKLLTLIIILINLQP
jgi:hypothetical protein